METIGIADLLVTGAVWVFWIGIIVLIGRAALSLIRRPDPAETALRLRLARGEIDEAEYERLRTTLQRG